LIKYGMLRVIMLTVIMLIVIIKLTKQ